MQFMICSKRLWTREKMLIAFVFILQLAENLTKLGFLREAICISLIVSIGGFPIQILRKT